jgi:tetratricopeptide (TPR) repeat protein
MYSILKSQKMPEIDLKTAVGRIYQIVEQWRERAQLSPYFFIAGAGVSSPPIPLAWEIEEQCKLEAQRYDDTNPPESKSTMDSYSHWLGKAYPSSKALQIYLRGLMENKPISKANLRLAHLLLDGRLARTVFTPNFDDMLAKALELFGQRPLVCDHPLTVGRIRIESEDIQIVHVHGSYWFYDCCNLRHEISDRSKYGGPVSVLLDQSLRDHSPLVIGYSGWEGDILMSALQRRLSAGKLGNPAFWFCYKRESLDTLPPWLTESNDIFFVLPDEPAPAAASPSATQPSEAKSQASPRPGGKAGIGDFSLDAKAPMLPADRVFDALVLRFEPSRPPLTQNPLSFYVEHLKRLLGTGDPEGEQDTYYAFHKVIARVERARDSEAAEQHDSLQGLRDAMSKADYRGAIKAAKEIALVRLSPKEQTELVFAVMDASLGLNDNSVDEMAGYDLVIKTADLLASAGSADLRLRGRVAKALLYKGITLGDLGRSEEEIAVYDEVVSRFADARVPALRERVANALFNKGGTLGTLGRGEEAIAVYDEVVRRFADAKEPALRELVAKALVNKGHRLGTLGRSEEAIAIYDEVVNRFADHKEPALREQVAKALVNKGFARGALGRSEGAITVYDEVVRRFADAKEPALREEVAMALVNKGGRLGTLDRSEEEIAVYDDVVRLFADAKEPILRERVAMALVNKGGRLGTLGKSEEAITVCDDVVRRFADAKEPALRERVAMALFNKGITLGTLCRSEEAIAVYDDIVSRLANAKEPGLREQIAMALVNKGFTVGALGRSEEAITVYDEVVSRFADANEPALREPVAMALVNRGFRLGTLGRSEEAIAVYDGVVFRFSDDKEPALRERVAKAILYRGMAHESSGDKEIALASYVDVLARFGGDKGSEIEALVSQARNKRDSLRNEGAAPE